MSLYPVPPGITPGHPCPLQAAPPPAVELRAKFKEPKLTYGDADKVTVLNPALVFRVAAVVLL
jgi:hypothetical protein